MSEREKSGYANEIEKNSIVAMKSKQKPIKPFECFSSMATMQIATKTCS